MPVLRRRDHVLPRGRDREAGAGLGRLRRSRASSRPRSARVLEGDEPSGGSPAGGSRSSSASPGPPPDETFWAIRRCSRRVARERPLLARVRRHPLGGTDLPRSRSSTSLIGHAMSRSSSCASRGPSCSIDRPSWGGGKWNATTIALEPLLEPRLPQALIANLLGAAELAPAVTRADPRGRRRQSAVRRGAAPDADRRRAPRPVERRLGLRPSDLATLAFPQRSARSWPRGLDRSRRRRACRHRASLGDRQGLLRRCRARSSPPDGRPGRLRATYLGARAARSSSVRSGPRSPARTRSVFRHLLIRDAAYAGIPKELRAQLHEPFAGLRSKRVAGDRVEEQEEIIGYHLEQALRLRAVARARRRCRRRARTRAADHLAAAGRRSFARGDAARRTSASGARQTSFLPDDRAPRCLLSEAGARFRGAGAFEAGHSRC